MVNEKHKFAFYYESLPTDAQTVIIKDQELVHHLQHVLRLSVGNRCVLFNQEQYAQAHIISQEKKTVTFELTNVTVNKKLYPHILFILPLLKREALKEAVYHATAAGANSIQLVTTQKSRQTVTEHEYERLQKVVIAAAQQAKQFAFPTIQPPQNLKKILLNYEKYKIVLCDPTGQSAEKTITALRNTQKKVALLIGPEGDFTIQEKEIITQYNPLTTRLTPTVLRAEDAALLVVGLVRTIL